MQTCRWCPENDDGDLLDQPCGRPARWIACCPVRDCPVCDDHRCRCSEPLLTTHQEGRGTSVSWTDQEVAYVTSREALLGVVRLWRL